MNSPLLLAMTVSLLIASEVADIHANPTKKERVESWQRIYGGSIPKDDSFLACLHHVNPQPDSAFVPFTEEQLKIWFSNGGPDESRYRYFKDIANPVRSEIMPVKHYLRPSRKHEDDLLLYEWNTSDYALSMMEKSSAIQLRVRPHKRAFDPQEGISGEDVAHLLEELVNFEYELDYSESSTDPRMRKRQGATIDQFRLPILLSKGTVFSNATRLDPAPSDWRNQIVGFITEKDVCLIVFNAEPLRMAADLPHDPDWLHRALSVPR